MQLGLRVTTPWVAALGALLLGPASSAEAGQSVESRSTLQIPRIEGAPDLEDFAGMRPATPLAQSMVRVDGFRQLKPRDGDSISQRTEAYLGYDQTHLYVVFVCFDSEPEKIRARLSRREDNKNDDVVDLFIDTFNDQLRGYAFSINPLGVQRDGSWIEGAPEEYYESFDMVWDSGGTLTPEGYVAWMAIPFRSLRFSPEESQEWGVLLSRIIRRANEQAFWPYVTTRIQGRLNQAAGLRGISDVSPGRNLQLIPYGFFRSFRALDTSDDQNPRRVSEPGEFDGGVDLKTVFRDSLVFDLTANPDFNQVESDEPQVTVNQRFEVFFPERRPFFLENASYFETPINLFFSRRIVEPRARRPPHRQGGSVRHRSAVRRRSIAGVGDPGGPVPPRREGPQRGLSVEPRPRKPVQHRGDLHGFPPRRLLQPGRRARCARADQPELDRDVPGGGQLDAASRWQSTVRAGLRRRGAETGRKLEYEAAYNDRSPSFYTTLGFLPGSRGPAGPGKPRNRSLLLRPDFRGVKQLLSYRFRPEGDVLISWGPDVTFHPSWRHDGSALDTLYSLDMTAELAGRTFVGAFYTGLVERLRPEEFPASPRRHDTTAPGRASTGTPACRGS